MEKTIADCSTYLGRYIISLGCGRFFLMAVHWSFREWAMSKGRRFQTSALSAYDLASFELIPHRILSLIRKECLWAVYMQARHQLKIRKTVISFHIIQYY